MRKIILQSLKVITNKIIPDISIKCVKFCFNPWVTVFKNVLDYLDIVS